MWSLETDLDEDTGDFVRAWRVSGLAGNPPAGVRCFVDRDLDELPSWLDAGFDLYAADQLQLAGLDTVPGVADSRVRRG